MDNLLSAINDHYHHHGVYPRVYVSYEFAFDYMEDMRRMLKDGIDVDIDTQTEDWRIE